jgi:hypothetical protein
VRVADLRSRSTQPLCVRIVNLNSIVNKIISVPANSIVNISATAEKSRIEAQRMQDVLTLLDSLTGREEATIKLIIDCLYDVGYVNAIDNKIRMKPLNSVAKLVARKSKPIVRIVAWRWFKKNCPTLIVRWLYGKVKF